LIGVIGPTDSIGLVRSAAVAEGLDNSTLMFRTYDSIETVAELATRLDTTCNVMLFTGEVPYAIARRLGTLQAALRYIPHSTNDLYRTLIQVLRENEGQLPTLSIDTMEATVIEEVFQDLDTPTAGRGFRLSPLWSESGLKLLSTEELVQFHVNQYARHETEIALTCLHEVDKRLEQESVPRWRIEHTKSSVQIALRDARLTAQVERSLTMQTVEGLVELPSITSVESDMTGTVDIQRRRVRMRDALLDYAHGMQGALAQIDESIFVVHTTRGAIDTALDRIRRGHKTAIRPGAALTGSKIGYGAGYSVNTAVERAWRALGLARRSNSVHVAFDDGPILNIDDDLVVQGAETTDIPALRTRDPDTFGLGSLALERLTAALRRVDASSVTAQELGEAYGIETRSARRILAVLEEAGVATEVHEVRSRSVGRPPRVYRIGHDKLLAIMEPGQPVPSNISIEANADANADRDIRPPPITSAS